MSLRDHHQSGASITTQYTQYKLSSTSERHVQIEPTNFNEQAKVSGFRTSGVVPIPRRKSPLSISYTFNDENDSNTTNEPDSSRDLDDQSSTNIVDCVDTNHLKAPLDITSTSSSHMQSYAYHLNDTHIAAGQSPDISTNINSPDKNNKNSKNNSKSTKNNTAVAHTLFDDTVRSNGNSQYKSETSLICRDQYTKDILPSKNEQPRSGSKPLSWIQHIDKRQPTWIRGFFDKHRRVNDEVAASNKALHPSSKLTNPTMKTFPGRLSFPPMPLQLTSYISSKLSVPYLKVAENSCEKHQTSKRRYAKNKRKGRKTSSHHHTQNHVTTKSTDDTPVHEGQRRRQPLLESDVYRLSHIKLANPRRSLREQVVIINSMFRYLSTLPTRHHHHHQQQQQWRLLYNFTAPPTVSSSSALKNTHSKIPSLSHSILPHLKHTLTTSSTTS